MKNELKYNWVKIESMHSREYDGEKGWFKYEIYSILYILRY